MIKITRLTIQIGEQEFTASVDELRKIKGDLERIISRIDQMTDNHSGLLPEDEEFLARVFSLLVAKNAAKN